MPHKIEYVCGECCYVHVCTYVHVCVSQGCLVKKTANHAVTLFFFFTEVHVITPCACAYVRMCVGGSQDFTSLLDQLNSLAQTAIHIKIEILQMVLGLFQLESHQKTVFRNMCGFHYLISVLATTIGSLAPKKSHPWDKGVCLLKE